MAARGKKYTQSHKSQVPDKKQGATSGVQYIKSKSNKSTLLYFAQCFPSCIYLHLFSILLFHVHNRAKAQNSAPVKLNPCFMSIQSTLSTFPSVVYAMIKQDDRSTNARTTATCFLSVILFLVVSAELILAAATPPRREHEYEEPSRPKEDQ